MTSHRNRPLENSGHALQTPFVLNKSLKGARRKKVAHTHNTKQSTRMDSQQPMDHLPNSEGVDGNENGAEQEQNYPSSVLEVEVLMAKLVG